MKGYDINNNKYWIFYNIGLLKCAITSKTFENLLKKLNKINILIKIRMIKNTKLRNNGDLIIGKNIQLLKYPSKKIKKMYYTLRIT